MTNEELAKIMSSPEVVSKRLERAQRQHCEDELHSFRVRRYVYLSRLRYAAYLQQLLLADIKGDGND